MSDCWSSELRPATYYRTVAVQARRLQADATTPRLKQYLDKMIAHCDGLAGIVDSSVSSDSDRLYLGRSRTSRNHDGLPPGFGKGFRGGWVASLRI